jgi:hypothetical protein
VTAAWLWARADLRQRWRSWVVLGLLTGATAGLAMAGIAGARRTANAVPGYNAAAGVFDAAVLANDPGFGAVERRAVAALPNVSAVYPFSVPFAFDTESPKKLGGTLLPTTPASGRLLDQVIVEGRRTDPTKVDEAVIDQNIKRKFHLGLGSTIVASQSVPNSGRSQFPPGLLPPGDLNFRVKFRVVGVMKSVSSETDWAPSSGFYDEYGPRIVNFVNMFVRLRHGEADFLPFQSGVQRIAGHPLNVERGSELLGLRKLSDLSDIEKIGLLLFALAVVIGGAALVGQALARAVTAGAADLFTWRAIGVDRRTAVAAMVLPATITTAIGAATAVVVAIALSPLFPIGVARRYDLDLGLHADWTVLLLGIVGIVAVVLGGSWLSAKWRVQHGDRGDAGPSAAGSWAARAGLRPTLLIGSRLAVETGRGRRAVPVRSALIGAIVGILGVVACFTFRAGITDALTSPERSGIAWNYWAASEGRLPRGALATISGDKDVNAAIDAVWVRAVSINHIPTSTFGTAHLKGDLSFVVLAGRAPARANEIAFAPTTASSLHVHIGDEVVVGDAPGRKVRVVGTALVPATSHTDFDQSAWMTAKGLRASLPSDAALDDGEDYALIRWQPGVRSDEAGRRLVKGFRELQTASSGTFDSGRAVLPTAVIELGRLRTLPLALGVFFALLGAATVAHALVTTVRRRRHDLAVLRSIGFTRRQSRGAIAWQATVLAAAGLVVGIPLGILTGRQIWRWCAQTFPVVYVAPLAAVVVLLVIPGAIALANALAAGPAHAAARIRPAEALRTE